jgi:hypothetical protein
MSERLVIHGDYMWALVKARKPQSCVHCGSLIAVGDECWRPLTNDSKRMFRMAKKCLKEKEQQP